MLRFRGEPVMFTASGVGQHIAVVVGKR